MSELISSDSGDLDLSRQSLLEDVKEKMITEDLDEEVVRTELPENNDCDTSSGDLSSLQEKIDALNKECQDLKREKDDLIQELERTKLCLQAESEALANKTDDSKELETLQSHTKKLELEIQSLTTEREALEANLEELDAQHQQAIESIIQSRDQLNVQNKSLVAQNEQLLLKLEDCTVKDGVPYETLLNVLYEIDTNIQNDSEDKSEAILQTIRSLVKACKEKKIVESECEKLKAENQQILENKSVLEEEKTEMVMTVRNDNERVVNVLQEQVTELQSMVSALEAKIRERDTQLGSLRDILKVYKENLDPDLEAAKTREAELQKKIDDLQKKEEIERARILAVLNDKARENSSLKAEVHRLVNVVSAEKAALGKLQKDCEHLAAAQKINNGEDEQTKQTILNLSRLVSDRNLEIEALKEKNTTLTSLLQDGSDPNSSTVNEIMKQLDEARRKVNQYQSEQEQIVSLLNQKHNESVAYHSELVKLSAAMQEEKQNNEMLREQNENVSKKLEDKQAAYLAAQNEAVTLQGKLLELEQQQENLKVRYNRLLQEDKQSEAVAENQTDGTTNEQVCESATTIRVDKEEWEKLLKEIERCRHMLQDRDRMLYEKDCLVHEKMRQIETTKELCKRKEEEVNLANQRHSHLSSQVESSKGETQAAREQNAALRLKMEDHRSEIALLKETNSALSVTLQEREFELKALRGKVETLSRLVEQQQRSMSNNSSRGEDEKNNIKKLLSDSEEMRQRAQGFQAERDQTMLALNHKQRENEFLQEQIRGIKEREERLIRELDRLRNHLLHVEESYTQEALRSEEREKELRTRLSQAEDRIQMATSTHSVASQHASLQVESLQEQLRSVMEQRDVISEKCSQLEDQLAQKAAAVRTLQVVLEQMQEEKRRDIAAYQVQCQNALRTQKEECLRLSNEVDSLAIQLEEANEALAAASRLTEQLDRKQETINMLKEQVEFQEAALDKTKAQIELMRSSSDITVDKTIIKNLVVGYLTISGGQQKEVLRVIATVLDFNKDEREKTGLEEIKIGWISWLSGNKPTSPSRNRQLSQQSLSEAFVRFLENESQPRTKVKLSIESLTTNRDLRSKRLPNASATNGEEGGNQTTASTSSQLQNPFVASLMPSLNDVSGMSLHHGEANTNSNMLMKPMSTALPTFVPFSDKSTANDILRDVLK